VRHTIALGRKAELVQIELYANEISDSSASPPLAQNSASAVFHELWKVAQSDEKLGRANLLNNQ